ncbi:MAG: MATE family efflux transporter [Flavobacteriaceae bacterium]|nr:MATE family efflux transporter [Flavobacteriaceae bacterium]|tara:strand:+ start:176 stop:1540 length:1365 start_codon:yes stop_codon:yes gene_type:complete
MLQEYTKEFKTNLRLAWPVMLGMVGHTLVQFVDNVMVGQLGTTELAAISLGNSFVFIAMSIGIGFSTAITPLIAEADAGQNQNALQKVLHEGLRLCIILGIFLFLGVYITKPLLFHMGQEPEVVVLAFPYLNWVAVSLLPLVIFQAFKQFSDGMSLTRYSMYATVLANVVNVVINYFLIFGIWIFPKWGLTGAAVGTLASRATMLVFVVILVYRDPRTAVIIRRLTPKRLYKKELNQLLKLGLPSSLQMFFEVSFFTFAIWVCGFLSKDAQAANQIALNLSSMTFMVAMGLSVAATIRVGNQKGFRAFGELKRIALSVFLLTLLLDVVFAGFFVAFNEWLPWLYLDSTTGLDTFAVAELAGSLLFIAAFFQIFDGAQVVALGSLRGLQDVRIPTWITFLAYGLIGVPIMLYLSIEANMGARGVWIGLCLGLVVSSLLLYLRFRYLSNKLIHTNV